MAMQLSCVNTPPQVRPPTDVEKMSAELEKIDNFMAQVNSDTANEATYKGLEAAVAVIDEIILSLDNSNDFFKIGGFRLLLPLLAVPNEDTVATTAELVADLCQNNNFCQTKALEINVLPELVKLLNSSYARVRSKALYAVSCLCRSNKEAMKQLEDTSILPSLMTILMDADEKLRAKTAFFLSHLSKNDHFRAALYDADLIGVLITLLSEDQDSSSEHLLSALREQVFQHVQSRVQCVDKTYNLKNILLTKVELYQSKSEHNEAREHCEKILSLCFPEGNEEQER